ncbi:MAG: prolyl oligopeptidase family serine peptidase [Planctomycetota bacterium]
MSSLKTGAFLILLATAVQAQGTREDYARAAALRGRTADTVTHLSLRPQWSEEGLWYRRVPMEYVFFDFETKTRAPLFDAKRLAAAIGKPLDIRDLELDGAHGYLWLKGDTRVWKWNRKSHAVRAIPAAKAERFRLPPSPANVRSRNGGGQSAIVFVNTLKTEVELLWIQQNGALRAYGKLGPGEIRDQHTFARHAWAMRRPDGTIVQRFVAVDRPRIAHIDGRIPPSGPPGRDRSTSPDGKWRVRFRDHNVELVRTAGGTVKRVTDVGRAGNAFYGAVHWAPDSKRLCVLRTKAGQRRTITMVESSPRDRVQPRVHTMGYVKPGDVIDHPRPWMITISGKATEVDDALFPQPWSLTRFRWTKEGLTFVYNERGHGLLRVIAVDKKPRVIIDEDAKTFVDYAGKFFLHHRDEARELIWMSERDGWNHLYRYDARTGKVRNQITKGAWAVRRVERVDGDRIWFWAGGVVPGEDPYHLHLCRVNLDGTGFVRLTDGDGTHTVQFSPDRKRFVDTWSRVDLPPVHVLRAAEDGKLITELERAEWSALLKTGWKPPIRFTAKGRDGKTDIYGILHRPTNLDPKRRYPVVEAIYAGPHSAHVPKSFRPFHGAQKMAELGFIVVQIDGMGTSHRSKAFHDVCWKNLGDAGFPDRIAWMRAAAKEHPPMDLTRVGIYGGSAGGQNAMRGLLMYPDFYKVGVADCGCHDNRMDKIWWNELWMSWPIGPHYKEQSNVTQAHRLQGKLMLIVGELDRNVDPASTMQVVDALVRANKDFDLVVIPGVGHGAAGTPYGQRRQADFLVRHLHGVEPRAR